MHQFILAINAITIVLSFGPPHCPNMPDYARTEGTVIGCANESMRTIWLDMNLPGDQFKQVFLHELAHIEYNQDPSMPVLFANKHIMGMDEANVPRENMANWFIMFTKWPDLFKNEIKGFYNFFIKAFTVI